MAKPRARASITARSGSGSCRGHGLHEVGHGVGGTGPAEGPRRGGHLEVRGRVVEQGRGVEQGLGIEVLVVDEPGRSGVDQLAGIRPLVAGRVRVRDDDDRQAEGGHLGERRGATPADDEVGRREGREHVVAQERVWPVPVALVGGEGLASGQGGRVAVLTGHVDDRDALHELAAGRRRRHR